MQYIFVAKRRVRKCVAIRSKHSLPFLEGKHAAVLWFTVGSYTSGNVLVLYYLCFNKKDKFSTSLHL